MSISSTAGQKKLCLANKSLFSPYLNMGLLIWLNKGSMTTLSLIASLHQGVSKSNCLTTQPVTIFTTFYLKISIPNINTSLKVTAGQHFPYDPDWLYTTVNRVNGHRLTISGADFFSFACLCSSSTSCCLSFQIRRVKVYVPASAPSGRYKSVTITSLVRWGQGTGACFHRLDNTGYQIHVH